MSSQVMKMNNVIPPEDSAEGVKSVIAKVRPSWNLEQVKFKVFTGGISNQLIGCFPPSGNSEALLVRIYGVGSELFIDRDAERRTMVALHEAGLGPALVATFGNGIVYYFVPGKILTTATVTDPSLWPLVARKMAAMHRLPCNGSPQLWDTLKLFLSLIPDDSFNSNKLGLRKLFSSKSDIETDLKAVEEALNSSEIATVFCHNDLLLANIVINETKDGVTFIDYEYAGPNCQAYDIANHFNEYAGVDDVDYSRLPNLDYQKNWIKVYLEAYLLEPPTDSAVDILLDQVQQFMVVNHLFWGLWAVVQSINSKIDFDFAGYAATRLSEYCRLRESS